MSGHSGPQGPELAALMVPGTRVVRGKDWDWGVQDGGAGGIGTVVGQHLRRGWLAPRVFISVRWDHDRQTIRYRMGEDGKYDLQLAPSTTINQKVKDVDNKATVPDGGAAKQIEETELKDTIVENVLECALCLDTFKEPRSLPCQHSFCKDCLQTDIDKRAKNGTYICPACRRPVRYGADGAEAFPRNYSLDRLIDIIHLCSGKTKQCEVCKQDGKDEKAMFRCFDCSEMLCESCRNMHKKFKVSADHTVLSLSDIKDGKCTDAIRALQAEPCPEHKTITNYYCKDCDRLICLDCINIGKCKHVDGRRTIEEATDVTKAELEEECSKLRQKIEKQEQVKGKANQRYKETKTSLKEYRKGLAVYVEHIKSELDAAANTHMTSIEAQYKSRLDDFERFQGGIQENTKTLQNTIGQSEKVLKIANISEMLAYKKCLLVSADEHDDYEQCMPRPLNAKFVPNEKFAGFTMKDASRMIGLGTCFEELWSHTLENDGDEGSDLVVGVCVLPETSHIVLVNRIKHQLVMLDENGTYKSSCNNNLKFPWGCTSTNGGDIIVRQEDRRVLQMLNWSEDNGWKVKNVMKTEINTLGLAVTNDNNLVISSFDPPALLITTQQGKVLQRINNPGGYLIVDPRFVTVNSKGHIIFTDWKLNSISILNKTGQVLHQYAPQYPELSEPHGVCTDDEDFIYVCDRGNNRVVQLYPDGDFCRVCLPANNIVEPMAIAFDRVKSRFIVANKQGLVKAFRFKL